MPILAIYELGKRLFFPVILPLVVAVCMYLKGYNSGYGKARLEYEQAQSQVSKSLRKAEDKNEELRHGQEKERIKVFNADLSVVICLFNAYFSGSTGSCYPTKTSPSVD